LTYIGNVREYYSIIQSIGLANEILSSTGAVVVIIIC